MSGSARVDGGDPANQSGRYNSDQDLRPSFEQLCTSEDIRREDRRIIDDDAEVEELLTDNQRVRGPSRLFGRHQGDQGERMKQSHRRRRDEQHSKRRGRAQGQTEEERGGLLFELEEGANRSSSESLNDSGEMDRQKLHDVQQSVQRRKPFFFRMAGIHVIMLAAFVAILYGAFKASHSQTFSAPMAPLTLNNGTALFAPTTILISLDGFRADFLHRGLTPNLNSLVQNGISPQYMLPSFPSVTFPNHFTLVTGLYPESHGVVGNTFWDPELHAEFFYTDPERSMQPKWWNAEPLWETLEYAGVKTAIHMWPGSEAHIGRVEPAYVDLYNGKELLSRKVDRVLNLLDLPGPDSLSADVNAPRPQLIALYVPDVDADGHKFGPNSTEIRTTIKHADDMIGDVISGLHERNLSNIVNIIVVSDHGMATTSVDRLIDIESLIDMNKVEHTDGWPSYGLRPKDEADLDELYTHLKAHAQRLGSFEVYLKDKDMPERYHFANNDRIAPLWVIPATGWAIVRKHELHDAMKEGVYHPRGIHGYDHEHPLMRAIFIARGPAFPHTAGSKLEVFQNIEVYNIVCDSVGVEPKANNGTLRLPLKPTGLHDTVPPGEVVEEYPAPSPMSAGTTVKGGVTISDAATSGKSALSSESETSWSPSHTNEVTSPPTPSRPVVHDGEMWWAWAKGKFEGMKDWAADLVHGVDNKEATDKGS